MCGSGRLTDEFPFWPSNPAKCPVTPGEDPLLYPVHVVVEALFSPSSFLFSLISSFSDLSLLEGG